MADMSELPDWLQETAKAYPELAGLFGSLQPSAKDKRDAFNNALLTAGAQILGANTGRQPGYAAIGQGLFGGIGSYTQNLADQRKDAMGRMQGITGLLGLGQQLRAAKMQEDFLKQFNGGGDAGLSVLTTGEPPTNPDFGMNDRSAGVNLDSGYGMGNRDSGSSLPTGVTRMAVPTAQSSMKQELLQMGVPANEIAAALASNVNAPATIAKMYSDAGKWQVGKDGSSFRVRPNGSIEYRGIDQNATIATGPDGTVSKVPIANSIGLQALAAGATTAATEQAKADVANQNELVDVPMGNGGTAKIPRGVALKFAADPRVAAALGQGQQVAQAPGNAVGAVAPGANPAAPPADVLSAMQWIQKSGTPVSWQPDTGLLIGDAATAYRQKMEQQAQPPQGQGQPSQQGQQAPPMPQGGPPQQGGPPSQQPAPLMLPRAPMPTPQGPPQVPPGLPMTTLPPDVQAARTAAATQAATMPGAVLKSTAEELGKADVAAHTGAMTDAKAAFQGNQMIGKTRDLIQSKEGIYGGALAPGIMGTAAFINGLGIPFDAARFSNSKEADKYMEGMALSLVKSYVGSTQISDRDVAAVKATMPRINDDPAARLRLLDTLQGINDRKINLFSRMDAYLGDKGSLRGFDYDLRPSKEGKPAIAPTESAAPAGLTPTAIAAEMRRRGLLK